MPRLAVLVAALAAMAFPAVARAATVSVENGTLTYTAAAGEVNELEIYPASDVPNATDVYEYAATVTPGAGCAVAPDPLSVPFVSLFYVCTGVTAGAQADLGDMDDAAIVYTPGDAPIKLTAGAGADFV